MRVALLFILLCFLCSVIYAGEEPESTFTNYEYWPSGVVRERTMTDMSGNVVRKTYYWENGLIQEDERFDSEGNKIDESHYDEQGRLTPGPGGWAAMRSSYIDGNLTGETTYDEFGRVIERKIYNTDGDLVDKQYFGDHEINPYEEYEPVPMLGTEEEQFFSQDGTQEGTTSVTVD